jgi:hypothetical protein
MRRAFFLTLPVVTLLGSSAFAQKHMRKPRAPAPATGAATPAPSRSGALVMGQPDSAIPQHKEGEYGGVTPGQAPDSAPAGAVRPKHMPPKGTLSWVGFEAKDGGAQLFLQSAAAFEISQHVEGNTLVAFLSLPRLGANTWRNVDTRFFDNPLSGVIAKTVGGTRATKDKPAHGAGIEVRIAFKNPKDVREGAVRTATEADGLFYTYLTFPEGADAQAATAKDPEK